MCNTTKQYKGKFAPVKKYRYSSAVTGLEWPRGFQEVKVPRFYRK
jgi:hypothetical protein